MRPLTTTRTDHLWCGPAAAALLTDGDYDHAYCKMLSNRRRWLATGFEGRLRGIPRRDLAAGQIRCANTIEVREVIETYWGRNMLGFRPRGSALHQAIAPGELRLIFQGRHFVASDGLIVADNNQGPRWWADHWARRKRARFVWSLNPGGGELIRCSR